MLLEKTFENPLDSKEINPVNPKGNQPWIFIGRTDVEAEIPILSPPDVKSQFTGKDLDAGKDWGQEEKKQQRMRWLDGITIINGHGFEQALGDGEGQGSLAAAVHGLTKSWTWLRHSTTTIPKISMMWHREGDLQRSRCCLWVENLKFTVKDTKAENASIVLERLSVRKRENYA